jgi:hypothetical protein
MNRRLAVLLGLSLSAAACAIATLDYTGKTCPCPGPSWVCNESAGVCERAGAADGGTPDGGTPEGSQDAAPIGDGDAGSTDGPLDGSWCMVNAPDAFFCGDFDEEKSLGSGWSQEKDPAGTTLDTKVYSSPFQSLRAAPPSPVASGAAYTAYVVPIQVTPWVTPATALHFGFDLQVGDVPDAGSFVSVAELGLVFPDASDGLPQRSLALLVYDDSAVLQEQITLPDGGKASQAFRNMPLTAGPGAWYRVAIDVALDSDAGAGQCSVHIGTNLELTPTPLTPGWTSQLPYIALGLVFSHGPLPDASVNIDNVTLDIH